MGSGGGTGAAEAVLFMSRNDDNNVTEASLTASLIIDPLNPTRDTPAMTVTNDIHLQNQCQTGSISEMGRVLADTTKAGG